MEGLIMAYKFQLGTARLSGSIILEDEMFASSSNGVSVSGDGSKAKVVKIDVVNSNKDGRIQVYGSGAVGTASVQIGIGGSQEGEVFIRNNAGADQILLQGNKATIMGSIELGHASDNTLTAASGDLRIVGNRLFRAGGADIPVADGGTGASNASGARTNLGVAIGSDVQAHDDILDDIAGVTQAANKGVYFDSNTSAATFDLTAAGRALLDDADAAAQRTTLGLGSAALAASADFQPADAELTELATMATATAEALADLSDAEVAVLDGATAGTAVASKALVVDSDKDLTGVRNLTLAGNLTVNGTQTIMNVATMSVQDANIEIANNANKADGMGLTIGSGSAAQTVRFQLSDSAANLSSSAPLKAPGFLGNATTATSLATGREIGGVSFNGTADIDPKDLDLTALTANSSHHVLMAAGATGVQTIGTDNLLTYNPTTNVLSAGKFDGDGSLLTGVAASGISINSPLNVGATVQNLSGASGVHLFSAASLTAGTNVTLHLSGTTAGATGWANGAEVRVKAPGELSGSHIVIRASGSQTIDGVSSIILESPNAAVSLVYSQVAGEWMIF